MGTDVMNETTKTSARSRRFRLAAGATIAAAVVTASVAFAAEGVDDAATAGQTAERVFTQTLDGVAPKRGTGNASNAVLRRQSGAFGSYSGTPGEVRLTCGTSHHAYDDPIVFPDQPNASHLHTFFGNAGTNAFSTYESLRAESRGSTCAGGSINKSSYWFPSLIDGSNNSIMEPTLNFVYYKTGYWGQDGADVQDIPDGLRMVSGNAAASRAQTDWHVRWTCSTDGGGGVPLFEIRDGPAIVACSQGNLLEASVMFPQCWNGTDLDSADHKSHMSHPRFNGNCPSSHPVLLPQITMHVTWRMSSSGSSNLYLSNDSSTPAGAAPGLGLHADFFEAWTPEFRTGFVEDCLNESKDCGVRLLGDGYTLIDP